ncbi:hypothetical protein [Streptomyces sp. NPDC020983]|uniref:hypothetical protein n=1 Tax=Streptomyces sp. NPDC020983 TaxID=3365106 RepID=UPI00378968EF
MQPETAQDPSGTTTRPPGTGRHRSAGSPEAARPVFLDPSGRRQRRVRRLGCLLAVPAAGYVALLLSTALGGPSVDSPYLPLPAAPGHGPGAATPRHAAPGPAHRTPPTAGDAASAGGTPTARAKAGSTSPAPAAAQPSASGSTTAATARPSATASPTVTHGRSTATHPVPTHTGHGRG